MSHQKDMFIERLTKEPGRPDHEVVDARVDEVLVNLCSIWPACLEARSADESKTPHPLPDGEVYERLHRFDDVRRKFRRDEVGTLDVFQVCVEWVLIG